MKKRGLSFGKIGNTKSSSHEASNLFKVLIQLTMLKKFCSSGFNLLVGHTASRMLSAAVRDAQRLDRTDLWNNVPSLQRPIKDLSPSFRSSYCFRDYFEAAG